MNALKSGMDNDYIHAQKKIELEDQVKPALGFEMEYAKEVDKVLPPRDKKGNRGKKGKPVWTPEIIEKLRPLNKKWPTL